MNNNSSSNSGASNTGQQQQQPQKINRTYNNSADSLLKTSNYIPQPPTSNYQHNKSRQSYGGSNLGLSGNMSGGSISNTQNNTLINISSPPQQTKIPHNSSGINNNNSSNSNNSNYNSNIFNQILTPIPVVHNVTSNSSPSIFSDNDPLSFLETNLFPTTPTNIYQQHQQQHQQQYQQQQQQQQQYQQQQQQQQQFNPYQQFIHGPYGMQLAPQNYLNNNNNNMNTGGNNSIINNNNNGYNNLKSSSNTTLNSSTSSSFSLKHSTDSLSPPPLSTVQQSSDNSSPPTPIPQQQSQSISTSNSHSFSNNVPTIILPKSPSSRSPRPASAPVPQAPYLVNNLNINNNQQSHSSYTRNIIQNFNNNNNNSNFSSHNSLSSLSTNSPSHGSGTINKNQELSSSSSSSPGKSSDDSPPNLSPNYPSSYSANKQPSSTSSLPSVLNNASSNTNNSSGSSNNNNNNNTYTSPKSRSPSLSSPSSSPPLPPPPPINNTPPVVPQKEGNIKKFLKKFLPQDQTPKWDLRKSNSLFLNIEDRTRCSYRLTTSGSRGIAKATLPLSSSFTYFEIFITSNGEKICVGLTNIEHPTDVYPGFIQGSYGFYGDGKLYLGTNEGKYYNSSGYRSGDVVGCGIDSNKSLYFTKNGVFLGIAAQKVKHFTSLYPTVGLQSPGSSVVINFLPPFNYKGQQKGSTGNITGSSSIVEELIPSEELEVCKWNVKRCGKNVKIRDRVASIPLDSPHSIGGVQSTHPFSDSFGYYEIYIENINKGNISIGLASKEYPINIHIGWVKRSYAYHSDDGRKFKWRENSLLNEGESYGPAYNKGDTIGCGYVPDKKLIFFTKNGVFLGFAFQNVYGILYPSVAFNEPGNSITASFSPPFKFQAGSLMNSMASTNTNSTTTTTTTTTTTSSNPTSTTNNNVVNVNNNTQNNNSNIPSTSSSSSLDEFKQPISTNTATASNTSNNIVSSLEVQPQQQQQQSTKKQSPPQSINTSSTIPNNNSIFSSNGSNGTNGSSSSIPPPNPTTTGSSSSAYSNTNTTNNNNSTATVGGTLFIDSKPNKSVSLPIVTSSANKSTNMSISPSSTSPKTSPRKIVSSSDDLDFVQTFQDGDGQPPSTWRRCGKSIRTKDDITLTMIKKKTSVAQANRPFSQKNSYGYFEVYIEGKDRKGQITVGLTHSTYPFNKHIGREPRSYGYSSDGEKWGGSEVGEQYGPPFFYDGDCVIGCGINTTTREIFFTKDGVYLGVAFYKVPAIPLYPSVSFRGVVGGTTIATFSGHFTFSMEKLPGISPSIWSESLGFDRNNQGFKGWPSNDVCIWLEVIGYGQYKKNFRDNNISGRHLLMFTHALLKDELGIEPLGHRADIIDRVARMSDIWKDRLSADESFASNSGITGSSESIHSTDSGSGPRNVRWSDNTELESDNQNDQIAGSNNRDNNNNNRQRPNRNYTQKMLEDKFRHSTISGSGQMDRGGDMLDHHFDQKLNASKTLSPDHLRYLQDPNRDMNQLRGSGKGISNNTFHGGSSSPLNASGPSSTHPPTQTTNLKNQSTGLPPMINQNPSNETSNIHPSFLIPQEINTKEITVTRRVISSENAGTIINTNDRPHTPWEDSHEWEIGYNELVFGAVIGKGFFGEVKRGSWRETDVAIKIIYRDQFKTKTSLVMFQNEVSILSKLRHPNIVQFLGACTAGKEEHHCIVTEWMGGGSLRQFLVDLFFVLEQNPHLRLKIALDIAKGMNYLHGWAPPILHRDLSSRNILLDHSIDPMNPTSRSYKFNDFKCKISDFGLSRLKMEQGSSMTASVGCIPYMAPEVFSGEQNSEKSDVYSYAMILWELLTSEEPQQDMKPLKMATLAAHENYRPPIPPTTSPKWRELLTQCWDFNPDKRPTFQQIIAHLKEMEDQGVSSFAPIPPPTIDTGVYA